MTRIETATIRALRYADAWIRKTCEHLEARGDVLTDPERECWMDILTSLSAFTVTIPAAGKIDGTPEQRLRAVEMVERSLVGFCREIAAAIEATSPRSKTAESAVSA